MWRVLGIVVLCGLLGIVAAMVWQHRRYVAARRDVVQDQQRLFHARDVFHAVLFLRSAPGVDVIDAVGALKRATEPLGASWIYAGKAALIPLQSSQLQQTPWTAVALLQFPSRDAFDRAASGDAWRAALDPFEETYTHGFERSALTSVAIPQMLLAGRALQLLRGQPSHFPFEPAETLTNLPEADAWAEQLLRERELGRDAIVIVNLQRLGTREQQAADRAYAAAMFGPMAEAGYGPLHVGRAVTVEGEARFDGVAIVYYAGVQLFADMMRSAWVPADLHGQAARRHRGRDHGADPRPALAHALRGSTWQRFIRRRASAAKPSRRWSTRRLSQRITSPTSQRCIQQCAGSAA